METTKKPPGRGKGEKIKVKTGQASKNHSSNRWISSNRRSKRNGKSLLPLQDEERKTTCQASHKFESSAGSIEEPTKPEKTVRKVGKMERALPKKEKRSVQKPREVGEEHIKQKIDAQRVKKNQLLTRAAVGKRTEEKSK